MHSALGQPLRAPTNRGRGSLVHETKHSILDPFRPSTSYNELPCTCRTKNLRRLEIFCDSSGYLSIMIPSRVIVASFNAPWGHGPRQTVWPGRWSWWIIGVLIGQIWCQKKPEAMDLPHCRYSTFQGNHLWSQVEGWDQRSFPVFGKGVFQWSSMDRNGCFGCFGWTGAKSIITGSCQIMESQKLRDCGAEKSPRLDRV